MRDSGKFILWRRNMHYVLRYWGGGGGGGRVKPSFL